jgi:transposase-like protein
MAEPTINLSTIAKHFSDEAAAYTLIEAIRWPDGPVCPRCGTVDHAYMLEPRKGERTTRKGTVSHRRIWKCGACRKQFSVLVGTIFEDSKVPLSKWLLTIHLLCAGKNGVSAHELHRQLGVTYKTAWFMAHRIRYAMERPAMGGKLAGIIEGDETYFGGKAKNMHRAESEYIRGDAHANTVEGYFSQLKRSIDGTYHHVSHRHLDRHLADLDSCYNSRKQKDGERTVRAIRQTTGRRLMYR